MKSNLLNSPEWNIRNFSKEAIEVLQMKLPELLKRVYSIAEKDNMINELLLDIAWTCFDSNFLDKKILGIKLIQDIMKQAKFALNFNTINISFLVTSGSFTSSFTCSFASFASFSSPAPSHAHAHARPARPPASRKNGLRRSRSS